MTNEEAFDALVGLVPFFRWRIGAPEPEDVVAADTDAVLASIVATGQGRGTDDLQVATSLWWQSYSYRVAGTTLCCWALSGVAPDVALDGTAVAIGRNRPSSVIYDPATTELTNVEDVVGRIVLHLDDLGGRVRADVTVGRNLLYGNTAASIESALGALVAAPGAPDLVDRVAAIHAALPDEWAATLDYGDGGYRRRTCCLWWKAEESKGRYCSDCSLVS